MFINNSAMGVKERLIEYLKYKGIGQNKFAESIGVSSGYVNNIRKSIQPDKLVVISKVYPDLNTTWLLTGDGNMILDSGSSNENKNNSSIHFIKYYPNVNGSMGGVTFLDDPNELVCNISIPGYDDCSFAINAYGDSMYPLIKSGQIILMTRWTERFIDWGRIYLVVTKSGYRVIKRLYPGSGEGKIMCKSENQESNPPFEIDMEDITKIYLVKGWICRDAI